MYDGPMRDPSSPPPPWPRLAHALQHLGEAPADPRSLAGRLFTHVERGVTRATDRLSQSHAWLRLSGAALQGRSGIHLRRRRLTAQVLRALRRPDPAELAELRRLHIHLNPYPYLRPLVERASGVRLPPESPTPHQVLHTYGAARLLRYAPAHRRHRTPILFVYSMINRFYILDFLRGRSLIEHLTGAGFDVYVLDWGTPGQEEERLGWGEVLGQVLRAALRHTLRASGSEDLTLYGYCMGGTLALTYAALYPEGVRSLVAQATPVDFQHGGVFTRWTLPSHFDVDSLIDAYGNLPTQLLETSFLMLAPMQRVSRWLECFRRIDDPDFVLNFLAMERWGYDAIPFPGEVYRQYIKDCYQQNLLVQGRMEIGGARVDLGRVRASLLNVIAEHDQIAPPAMSEPLTALVGSEDVRTLRFPVGHIGLSASSRAPAQVWPAITAWIAERSAPLQAAAPRGAGLPS